MEERKKEAIHAGFAISLSVLLILYITYVVFAAKGEQNTSTEINTDRQTDLKQIFTP